MKNMDYKERIGFLIIRTAMKMKIKKNKVLRENNFSVTADQYELLSIIYEGNGLTQTEIAEKIGKDKTIITRMLDSMERKNILERRKHETDRRAFKIYLTDKGLTEKKGLLKYLDEKTLLKNISKKEIEIFKSVINSINNNIII